MGCFKVLLLNLVGFIVYIILFPGSVHFTFIGKLLMIIAFSILGLILGFILHGISTISYYSEKIHESIQKLSESVEKINSFPIGTEKYRQYLKQKGFNEKEINEILASYKFRGKEVTLEEYVNEIIKNK